MPKTKINKIVLAYSGGLDTSVILHWLQEHYQCEVITFTADIGQGEDLEQVQAKAAAAGVKQIYVEDLREEFVKNFVFPMFRANALYEGEYLLGTSIARPLIARRLVEIAMFNEADAIAHGATGKGNDQVRFELGAYAFKPDIHVIAPWREWDLSSREKLLAYAEAHGIPVALKPSDGRPPYSMDANLLHISYEGNELEDPWMEPNESMWRWTVDATRADDRPRYITIDFVRGDPIAIDEVVMSPAELLLELNKIAGSNGVGRTDIVENRYVGIKSRGCYETPGGTVLLKARRAMESLTLDREVAHLKDEMMPRYASLIYNGYWFSPERIMLQEAIDQSQYAVSGKVRLKLYKGSVQVVGRASKYSLQDRTLATFDEDAGAYNQGDASGFINLNSLRIKAIASRKLKPELETSVD